MQVKASQNRFLTNTSFIVLHNDEWLQGQRHAGKITAGALSLLEAEVKAGTSKTLIELDALAETFIRDNGCTPTFLYYKGFPNSVCMSVNKQLVHGVPTDYRLQDGDLISFDLGATDNKTGAIGDSAFTTIFGEPKSLIHINLIQATKVALNKAIQSVKVGERIGVIGDTISQIAKIHGFSVISTYGGHSMKTGMAHAPPFVSNKDIADNGVRIQENMCLAIEPLFVIGGSAKTKVGEDGWTVECLDYCAHEEATIYIHKDGVEILTKREKNKHDYL
jgi:methionyl aminopeptidase